MFFKSGVSTPASVAVLSIATAGVLSSNDYSTIAQFSKMESQIENVKTLSDSFLRRLAKDSTRVIYTMDANKISAKGAIWTTRAASLTTSTATFTTTEGSSWSNSVLKDPEAKFNTEEIRVLTTGSEAQCPYHDTGTNRPGKWTPNWNDNPAFNGDPSLKNTSLLPCNLFRLTGKGPLGNSTTTDILSVHTVSEDNNRWRRITGIEFNIPMDKIITQENYGSAGPYFLSQVKQTFKGSPVSVSIAKGGKKYGFNPSLFLNSDCSRVNTCSLNISYNPKVSVEALAGGCNDCVKQDGSNSMNSTLTFRNIEDATPVIAWQVNGNKEVPDKDDVIKGIINYNTGLEIMATKYDIITLKENNFTIQLSNANRDDPITVLDIDSLSNMTNLYTGLTVNGDGLFKGDLVTEGKLTANDIVSTGGIKLRNGSGDILISNEDGNAIIENINPAKKFMVRGAGIESAKGYTINADNKWDENALVVDEAIVIKSGTIEVADTTIMMASNDNWIPYPGDDIWQLWTPLERLEWSRQIPNAYTVAKMIGNVLEPFTQQIKDLAAP